ncbi:MAG: N-methylhydantoinase [Thermoleophilaceae bacterium]|jgi:N-methylhydantoinase A|nr:N-methylhydantoinase [Thermoleophilaceae bacterium]
MSSIIGVDTGGTFTDVVVLQDDGTTVSAKAATTGDDLEVGILAAITEAGRKLALGADELLGQTEIFRLSGTTVTNVVLTGQGVATGLLTTVGFEDTLHIGRGKSAWAGGTEEEVRRAYRRLKPAPLVPKPLVRGIAERVDSTGSVVVPLSHEQLAGAADELVDAGAKSLAVCFVWSVRNSGHELEARDIIAKRHPDVSVHLSHAVAPSAGEYERFTTTVVDALAGPVMDRLLRRLRTTLGDHGFDGELLVAQADGGAAYAEETRPVSTLQSGPAAGVIASRNEGRSIGKQNVVTADVGGTSFDVAVVADGEWLYSREPTVGKLSLSLPMIEVESVGAGGGSIAWVDELDVLHVGPHSAGANPGPVCYGLGGTEPTVTDAALVLGYLNPEYFLGGRVELAASAAEEAVTKLGEPLGLTATETAAGIFAIANAHMAGLITRRVVSRGYDPRDFVVFAYGGAGGMHGAFYAAETDIPEVVIPALAGTFSALGVTTAPLLHTARRHDFAPIPMDADRFVENFRELQGEVVAMLERDGVPEKDRTLVYALDMRYGVQVHTVRLVISPETCFAADFETIREEFDATYEKLYGKGSGYGDAGRFATAFIVEGYGRLAIPSRAPSTGEAKDPSPAFAETRDLFFDGSFVKGSIYRYGALRAGNEIPGPAVIEAPETTIVVPPDRLAWVDPYLNVRIGTAAAADREG